MAYIKVDEDIEIKEYHIHGEFDGVKHIVIRTNKDNSISIVCRGNLQECREFCRIV